MQKVFKKGILISALVFVFAVSMLADNRGTEFWLAFPGNYFKTGTKSLYITSDADTSGNIHIASPVYDHNFSVSAGGVVVVILPQLDTEVMNSNTMEWKGVHVTSLNPVTVYGMNNDKVKSDSFLGIPVTGLGTEYLVQSYSNSAIEVPLGGTQFAIAGTEDNTQVTMTLSVDTNPMIAATPYIFTLNEGQVYYLRNTNTPSDLTGSYISANKRVAVFGSHACADIPVTEMYCDPLVEQLPPVTSWGKEFVIIPLANRNTAPGLGDTYRFLAWQNGTTVYLDGSPVALINKGQTFEAIIRGAGRVTSNNRIMITQYANGTEYDGETGDPFMMTIMPVEQYLDNYLVYTPEIMNLSSTVEAFPDNYLNISVPNAAVGSVTVDSTTFAAGSYTVIGASGYSALVLSVPTGVHSILSSLPVGVSVYGFSWRDGYGHPGGGGTTDFVSTPTSTVTPTITQTRTSTPTRTKTSTPGDTATYTATPTVTPTQSESQTMTDSPTVTMTLTETPVYTLTETPSFTKTITITSTPTYTLTSTFTASITLTRTATLTFTKTATPSMTTTFTMTFTKTITQTVTLTFTKTLTLTVTATRTITATAVNTPTTTPTQPALVLKLLGVYPNPVSISCNIAYWLSRGADIQIKIWDVSGEVIVVKKGIHGNKGNNVFLWDRTNSRNWDVASGVFIYEIIATTEKGEKAAGKDKLAVVR